MKIGYTTVLDKLESLTKILIFLKNTKQAHKSKSEGKFFYHTFDRTKNVTQNGVGPKQTLIS